MQNYTMMTIRPASDDSDDFESFTSTPKGQREGSIPKRENPYVAPGAGESRGPAKYIPPSLRKPADDQQTQQLRRQLLGLLNKLSESNLISILREVETTYSNNARQHVTSTLIDLLIGLISDRSTLSDTFMILHAAFVSAVHKTIGVDIVAQLIEMLVEKFDATYDATTDSSKEPVNLISFLAQLYNFQVIGSEIVFDYVRMFLSTLSELNTELLLRIVKLSGQQLRQDDPTSLKDITVMLHRTVASGDEASMSVRTKFMIETISNLRNNKLKANVDASSIVSEHLARMRKLLVTLNTRAKASEPLRASLNDIRNSENQGKWWLVGASWKKPEERPMQKFPNQEINAENDAEFDLVRLAKEQGMNTDIRRAIFITIMSATDYKNAHERLLRLSLTRSQEVEIPRVLLHCVGAEQRYNPYYSRIGQRLCAEHKLRMAFQFALWDLFKRMDESDIDGAGLDDVTHRPSTIVVVNVAKFFGDLLTIQKLSIAVLKVSW